MEDCEDEDERFLMIMMMVPMFVDNVGHVGDTYSVRISFHLGVCDELFKSPHIHDVAFRKNCSMEKHGCSSISCYVWC